MYRGSLTVPACGAVGGVEESSHGRLVWGARVLEGAEGVQGASRGVVPPFVQERVGDA